MGQKIFLCFTILFVIFSLSITSAEIMLTQPSATYNLGDSLGMQTIIKANQDTRDFFELNLKCGEQEKNLHREYLSLKVGEEEIIKTSLSLTKALLGNLIGNCYVRARFSGDLTETQQFKISDKINVSLNIENVTVMPGKSIEIKGTATKENSMPVEGYFELDVENTDIKILRDVKNGSFISKLTFPENIKSGYYVLQVRVYEKFNEEITNEGQIKTGLLVKQIPTKIELTIEKQNVKPESNISFTATILDQSNDKFTGDIALEISGPDEKVIMKQVLESGEQGSLLIKGNLSSGYYKIKASSLGLTTEKLFYVEEQEKAEFELMNDTLVITNTGNIIYRKPVQIFIGNESKIKNLELDTGKIMKLKLSAPNGSYQVRIDDGENNLTANVFLTGSAVGIHETGEKSSLISRYPTIWLFLILILGLFIFVLGRRKIKRRLYTYPVEPVVPAKEKPETGKAKKKWTEETATEVKKAEHDLVMHGRKEDTSIIAIKMKNPGEAEKTGLLNKISNTIEENRGVLYKTSDFLIGLFPSLTTKTFKNEMIAIKVARKINELLKEHNNKSEVKIEYGISLNSGPLILRKEQEKIKFTGLGNTLSLAKKISNLAREEVLMSDDMYNKTMSEVRADKETREGLNIYHIKRIIERDKHREFISDFLARLGQEKKK
jgi:hypothetical protein